MATREIVAPDLTPNRASDRVAEELRHIIITMELPPGVMVSQAYLMERLKCGRTPLREALQRLIQEYLVIPVPGGGISIAGLSIVDFVEMSEALDMVEGFALKLAMKRISEGDLAKLRGILADGEAADRAGDFSTVAERDFEFHYGIAQATGNRYVIDASARLHRLATRFGYISWQRRGSAETSLQEHRQILRALESQDLATAEHLTHQHTLNARQRIVAAL